MRPARCTTTWSMRVRPTRSSTVASSNGRPSARTPGGECSVSLTEIADDGPLPGWHRLLAAGLGEVISAGTTHSHNVPVATIDVTDPAVPCVLSVLLAWSRCRSCREGKQAGLLNLLSHDGLGCLSRHAEAAAAPVVRRTQQLHGDLAAHRGI